MPPDDITFNNEHAVKRDEKLMNGHTLHTHINVICDTFINQITNAIYNDEEYMLTSLNNELHLYTVNNLIYVVSKFQTRTENIDTLAKVLDINTTKNELTVSVYNVEQPITVQYDKDDEVWRIITEEYKDKCFLVPVSDKLLAEIFETNAKLTFAF